MHDARSPRRRERGASALKVVVILTLLLGAGYAIAYAYGSYQVGAIETALSRRLPDAGRPTPTEMVIDEDLIKRRIASWAREEGAEVRPEDVEVTIEPLNDANFQKLPFQARFAIDAARKMKNHDVDAAFLGLKVRMRAKWGPVKVEREITRESWVPKSALR